MSPAAPLFFAACIGAVVGLSAPVPLVAWLLLLAGGAVGLFQGRTTVRLVALLVAAAAVAGGGAELRRDAWRSTVASLPEEAILEGVVTDDAPSRAGRTLTLDVTGALPAPGQPGEARPLRATVRVGLRAAAIAFSGGAGDRVRVFGRLRQLHPADRPGAFDAALFGLARGLHARVSVYDPARIAVVERGAGAGVWSRARASLRERLGRLTTPREAGVVLALLIGDTSSFDEEQHALYRAVGAGHLLAVSGLQVTLLAVLLFGIARLLLNLIPAIGRRSRARAPAALLAFAGVWAFVALCGAPPSCVRAAAMATAGLLALLVGRRAAGFDALGLAGLVTVLLSPTSAIDPSFLLSYAAVLGLLLAGMERPRTLLDDGPPSLGEKARAAVLGAAGTGLLTLPISAHLFGEVSPGGLLANVVLVPAAALLQVPALGLGLLGGLVESTFLVELGAACAGLLEALSEGLGQLMGGLVEVRGPSGVATLVLTLGTALVVGGVARRRRGVLGAGAVVVLLGLLPGWVTPGGVRISVLPVGQGDGAVFELPDGTVMVVDGGGVWDEHRDPGEEVVIPHLRRRGIERVDVVVLSHPDPDHLLGLLTVLREVEVGELWHSGYGDEHPLMARLLSAAKAHGVVVRSARELLGERRFGETVVEVLAPRPEDGSRLYPELTPNDNSVVLRITYGEDRALWAGDVEDWGERYLLRDSPDLEADVLKAPHHGSSTSSTPPFIEAVSAEHVVFPTGRGNQWGFPHAPVVGRYQQTGAALWDTAVHGEITIWLSGEGVVVEPWLDASYP